ncbi:MAG: LamG-like jellyroll fold domain-containing protein, partial [Marinoscillum sp.]
ITGDGTIAPSSAISSDAGLHWKVRSSENASYFVDISGGFLENDTWHHVAAVKEGSDYRLYLDGNEVANSLGTTIFDATNNYSDRDKIVLGANWNNSAFTTPLDGELDETRIWNVARTAEEIRDNLYNTIPSPTAKSNLMSYYDFNQGVAGGNNTGETSLLDRASVVGQQNANNGTFVGFALDGSAGGGLERNFVESNALTGFLPEDPNGLYTIDVSSSQIDLAWNDNSWNETSFKIERSTDLFGTFTEIATVPADQNYYIDNDVISGSEYWYAVRAVNETGYSQYDGYYIGTTYEPPHNALDFDGIDDYVRLGNGSNLLFPNEETDDYSFEGWFLTNDNATTQGLMAITGDFSVDTEPTTGVYITSGGQLAWSVVSGEDVTPFVDIIGGAISNGTWHHFAATKSGNDYRLYLDGVEVGSSIGTSIYDATNDYSDRYWLVMGAGWGGSTFANPLNGRMDEVRYWNDARTPSEISDNRFNTIRGDEANIEAYFRFDEGIADGFNSNFNFTSDRSSNVHHGPSLFGFSLSGTATSNFVTSGAMDAGVPPTDPSNLLAVDLNQSSIQLQWQDNSSNESGFEIQRSDNEGAYNSIVSLGGNSNNYTDNSVSPGNSYQYRINAFNGATVSSYDSAFANTYNHPGLAFNFSDGSSYVDVPDNSSLEMPGAFTIEFWMKTTDTGNKIIIEKGSGNAEYSIQQSSGDKMIMQVGSTPIVSEGSYNDGNWHHFVFIYRGANDGDIYVDGVRDVDTNTMGTPSYGATNLHIGSRGGTSGIIGELDAVRIWNEERALQDIEDKKYGQLDGDEPNLVAYYSFNQSTGILVPDHSLSKNHGTLIGGMDFDNDAFSSGAIAPANFFVKEVSDTEIQLTWTDNLSDETDYVVEKSATPDFASPTAVNLGSDVSSYTDNVASGVQMFYRVQGDRSGTLTAFTPVKFGSTMAAPGNALDFAGTDDAVIIEHNAALEFATGDFTIEGWVDLSESQTILAKKFTLNDGRFFAIRTNGSGVLELELSNTTPTVLTGVTNIATGWHHFAFVRSGGIVSLYVDGNSTAEASMSMAMDFDNSSPLVLGAEGTTGSTEENPVLSSFMIGQMDEIRIWNIARANYEIAENAFTPLVGNETGLVAYYKFDQGLSISDNTGLDVLPDRSTNNNSGSLQGFALNGSSSNWFTSGAMNPGVVPNSAPSISTSRVSDTQIDLEFEIGATNATSLEIQYATTFDGSYTTLATFPATAETYSHTGLTPGDGFFYKPVAVNATGVAEGNPAFGTTTAFPGYAITLDGTDDYIDLSEIAPIISGEGSYTIEFWFKANSTQIDAGEVALFFINNMAEEDAFGLMIGTGATQDGLIHIIDQGVEEAVGTTQVLDDQWHHIGYTWNGGPNDGILYLDGVVEASHTLDYALATDDDWT